MDKSSQENLIQAEYRFDLKMVMSSELELAPGTLDELDSWLTLELSKLASRMVQLYGEAGLQLSLELKSPLSVLNTISVNRNFPTYVSSYSQTED